MKKKKRPEKKTSRAVNALFDGLARNYVLRIIFFYNILLLVKYWPVLRPKPSNKMYLNEIVS